MLVIGLILLLAGAITIAFYFFGRAATDKSTVCAFANDWIIAIVTIVITLTGAWLIFQKEGERLEDNFKRELDNQRQIEHRIYKRSFSALLTELSANQALIKKQQKSMTQTSFNLELYQTAIAEKIIAEPLTYKYTGDDFWLSLQAYLSTARIANRWLDFLWGDFQKSGQVSEKNLSDFKERLDQYHRALLILQIQTQILVYANDVKSGPTLGDGKTYLRWMTGEEKKTIEDLEKYIQDLASISDDEKKKLRESFSSSIRD